MCTTGKNLLHIVGFLMAFGWTSCQSDATQSPLPQRYLEFYPHIQNGWVFVLPQNACIPCNRKAYQWWQKQTESENTYLIADYPLFEEAPNLIIDTIPFRMAQHNPYVSKSFALKVVDGSVVHHFPIDPKNVNRLDSLLELHVK